MDFEQQPQPYALQPPTWRHWGFRLFGGALLLCSVVYMTLPLWLPMNVVARLLTNRLSLDFKRPVTVGSIEVGWIKGVVIHDLTVAERPGWPNPHLVRIERIRCDFAPLTMLFHKRLPQIDIVAPRLWLAIDEQGRLNIEDFDEPRTGQRLPSFNYQISDAACYVQTPAVTQTFVIDRLTCHLDPETGRLRLFSKAQVDRPQVPSGIGRFVFAAEVMVPRLRREVKLDGQINLEWTDLTLSDLPVPLATRLPVEQVDGLSTGRLKLNTRPDLDIDFDFFLALKGIKIVRPGMPHPVQVPDAELICNGHWDPISDELHMNAFEYLTPGVHLHRRKDETGPAMVIDRGSETPFRIQLAGRVRDWLALRREFPEIDVFARRLNTTLSGQADFSFQFEQHRSRDHLRITVDAGESHWLIPNHEGDILDAPAGLPKIVYLEVIHNQAATETLESALVLNIGQCSLSADSMWTIEPSESTANQPPLNPLQLIPNTQSHMTIQAPDMRELPIIFPFLANYDSARQWQGPLKLTAILQPKSNAARLEFSVAMDTESTFTIGDYIEKPVGQALLFDGGLELPYLDSTCLSDFWFDLRAGPARLSLDRDRTLIEYAFRDSTTHQGRQATDIDARCVLPVRMENVQTLLNLFPVARDTLGIDATRRLNGNAELICNSRLSYRSADWILCNEISVIADQLDIRWDHWLNKPSGTPMTVTGAYQLRDLDAQWEHLVQATLAHPGGRLSASALFTHSESGPEPEDVEHLRIEAEMSEISDWINLSPVLTDLCLEWRLRGSCRVHAESLLLNNRQKVTIAIDATAAEWDIPGRSPMHKPVGMTADTHLELLACPDPKHQDRQEWKIVRGDARLGGLLLQELTGMAVMSTPSRTLVADRREWLSPSTFEVVHLRSAGQLSLDESIGHLHPPLADFCRQFDLAGKVCWNTLIEITPNTFDLLGILDAENVEFRIPIAPYALGELHKPAALPALLSFNLTMDHTDSAGGRIDLRELSLKLAGNTFSSNGSIRLPDQSGLPVRPQEAQLFVQADLPNPHGLLPLFPDSSITGLDGTLWGEANLILDDRYPRISGGQMRLKDFAIALGGEPLHLNGRLLREPSGRLEFIGLQGIWGPSQITLSGHVYPPGLTAESRLGITGPCFDWTDVRQRLTNRPTWDNPTPDTQPADTSKQLRDWFAVLGQMNLTLFVNFDSLRAILPPNVQVSADALVQYLTLNNGQVDLQFRSLLDGGFVNGRIRTNVLASDPVYHLTYEALQIPPGPVTESYLDKMFIGMTATGPLTLIDETYQKFFPAPDELNYEVGQGELIIEGGVVEGRAAPLWMTNVFPRLNLAQFDFSYMHSWFEKFRDGTVRHQIIYQGRYYNIYSVGNNYPDRRMDYEVGIDFLADFDSQYWAESGQGRIPLFRKTGYLRDDGSLADEIVTYVPQRFIWNFLTRNNPVFTVYHAIRKRILGES
ncbi:MAG: hypothetical protein GXY44_01980 [Phycisphaerales bacterium]|nr:hypothetical protein [Phycisphaerales bacterium]